MDSLDAAVGHPGHGELGVLAGGGGLFPALVLGVWWKRATTAAGAVAGMIAGFCLCLFYLVVTRYYPQAGVDYFGMTAMTDPVTGAPVVDITKPILPAAAQRVGWFG